MQAEPLALQPVEEQRLDLPIQLTEEKPSRTVLISSTYQQVSMMRLLLKT